MKVIDTYIKGLKIIEPEVVNDSRGYFFEPYNKPKLKKFNLNFNFIQDNESLSTKGVLRGFHFQKPPFDQTKLVRCIRGEVLDIALDLRRKSETYGEYMKIILSGKNKKQFLIPRGFAHAFLVLSKDAIFSYKVDNPYNPKSESGIVWNDSLLSIDWGVSKEEIIISDKDMNLNFFEKFKSPF